MSDKPNGIGVGVVAANPYYNWFRGIVDQAQLVLSGNVNERIFVQGTPSQGLSRVIRGRDDVTFNRVLTALPRWYGWAMAAGAFLYVGYVIVEAASETALAPRVTPPRNSESSPASEGPAQPPPPTDPARDHLSSFVPELRARIVAAWDEVPADEKEGLWQRYAPTTASESGAPPIRWANALAELFTEIPDEGRPVRSFSILSDRLAVLGAHQEAADALISGIRIAEAVFYGDLESSEIVDGNYLTTLLERARSMAQRAGNQVQVQSLEMEQRRFAFQEVLMESLRALRSTNLFSNASDRDSQRLAYYVALRVEDDASSGLAVEMKTARYSRGVLEPAWVDSLRRWLLGNQGDVVVVDACRVIDVGRAVEVLKFGTESPLGAITIDQMVRTVLVDPEMSQHVDGWSLSSVQDLCERMLRRNMAALHESPILPSPQAGILRFTPVDLDWMREEVRKSALAHVPEDADGYARDRERDRPEDREHRRGGEGSLAGFNGRRRPLGTAEAVK